jgi:uncharacterized protein YcnI
MKKVVALLAAAGVAAIAGAAWAHVEPVSETAPAGQISVVELQVPHGCDGSPTTALTVKIPAGVNYLKPKAKPGWKITTKVGKLPKPVKAPFGTDMLTTGVLEVTWSGGRLPDAWYDTFPMLVGMPNTPGKTMYFPAVQRCVKGVTRWIEIGKAGQPEPEHPAPAVKLVKGTGRHD